MKYPNKPHLALILLTALIMSVMISASPVAAGTVSYNDYGTGNVILTITGEASDSGYTLQNYKIEYLGDERFKQLMEVEIVPGTGAAQPSAVPVTIYNADSILWGPQTIDITKPAALPGSTYGGHITLGILPIVNEDWYLDVGVLGTGDTIKLKLKFK